MPGIHQTKNFLEKKENRAWNSKQRIEILVERNEIITTENFSPLQVEAIDQSVKEKKKSNQRILL